jgi:hypothetical protein
MRNSLHVSNSLRYIFTIEFLFILNYDAFPILAATGYGVEMDKQ